MEVRENPNRIVRGKPVFTIIPSESAMRRFIQENRENLKGRTEAYTPVSENKRVKGLYHLRVYKSPTSRFYLPASARNGDS